MQIESNLQKLKHYFCKMNIHDNTRHTCIALLFESHRHTSSIGTTLVPMTSQNGGQDGLCDGDHRWTGDALEHFVVILLFCVKAFGFSWNTLHLG